MNDILYLVATRHTGLDRVIDRNEFWDAPGHLLAISPNGTGPQDILLLDPSNWYGVLRALAILMPCLGDWTGQNFGVIMQAFRVVRRPHLKGDKGAPLSDVMIHAHMYVLAGGTATRLHRTLKRKGKCSCRERNLDGMVLEERIIKCRLFVDVYTVYDISIWALLISQNQWSQPGRN